MFRARLFGPLLGLALAGCLHGETRDDREARWLGRCIVGGLAVVGAHVAADAEDPNDQGLSPLTANLVVVGVCAAAYGLEALEVER